MGAMLRTALKAGLLALMLAAPPARGDDPPKDKAKAEAKADDAGDAKALLRTLMTDRPDFSRAATREEALVQFVNKQVPLADRITAHADAAAEDKAAARQRKLFLLHAGAKQAKDKELGKQYDAYAAAILKDDPKGEMAGFVQGLAVIGDGNAPPPPKEALAYAKDFPKHPFVGQIVLMAARGMEGGDDPEAAKKFVKELLAALPAGPAAKQLEAMLKGMEILGAAMEIAGPTLAGKAFDIKDLKGKIVLVDFWATWCGPCIAELPNVKKAYDRYHAKGFEVVAISLDSDQKELEDFVKEQKLPWTQVFHKPKEGDSGWTNPLAEKYGITGIPAMFLLDKDGKVLSRSVRGESLQKKLAELLGPVPDSDEKPEPAKAEKK